MSPDHTADRTLELFVRSLASDGTNPKQAAILDRVDELVETGPIGDYSVHVVGREVCPETARATEPGTFICDRVVAFRGWAARNGLSIDSFVEPRSVSSELTGETYEAIVFPTVVLAEFEGEHLRAVAPCTDGERLYTVTDLLDALEADDRFGASRPESGAPLEAGGGRLDAGGRPPVDGGGEPPREGGDPHPDLEPEADRDPTEMNLP